MLRTIIRRIGSRRCQTLAQALAKIWRLRREAAGGSRGLGMTKQSTTVQSTDAIRRWRLHAFVTLAATAALTAAPPADAAPRQARPERTTEAAAPRDAGEPIM